MHLRPKTHHSQRASRQTFRRTRRCCKDQEHRFLCSAACQTACMLIPLCSQAAEAGLERVLRQAASRQPSPGLPRHRHRHKALVTGSLHRIHHAPSTHLQRPYQRVFDEGHHSLPHGLLLRDLATRSSKTVPFKYTQQVYTYIDSEQLAEIVPLCTDSKPKHSMSVTNFEVLAPGTTGSGRFAWCSKLPISSISSRS
ncbi:hypothetical protein EDD85DRAFT_401223 [Armillaria nabsnona]|nr:hypothetical protein EDD85DRAFT_401223 [Armillaria nabsnona]